MSACPTVKIASKTHPSGYIIINESDFDPAFHALFDVSPAPTGADESPDTSDNTDVTVDPTDADVSPAPTGATAPSGAARGQRKTRGR